MLIKHTCHTGLTYVVHILQFDFFHRIGMHLYLILWILTTEIVLILYYSSRLPFGKRFLP